MGIRARSRTETAGRVVSGRRTAPWAVLYVDDLKNQQPVEPQVRALEEYAERGLPEYWHRVVVDRGPDEYDRTAWGMHISEFKDVIDHVMVHDVRDLARSKRVFDLIVQIYTTAA